MSTRKYKLWTLATAWLAVLCLTSLAQAADPNGTWAWTVSRQGGQEFELSVDLKQDGEKLTGEFTLPFGDSFEIQDGTFKDDQVEFTVEVEFGGNTRKMKFKGKVDGDTITGTTERERDGEVRSREWEAKRQKKEE